MADELVREVLSPKFDPVTGLMEPVRHSNSISGSTGIVVGVVVGTTVVVVVVVVVVVI